VTSIKIDIVRIVSNRRPWDEAPPTPQTRDGGEKRKRDWQFGRGNRGRECATEGMGNALAARVGSTNQRDAGCRNMGEHSNRAISHIGEFSQTWRSTTCREDDKVLAPSKFVIVCSTRYRFLRRCSNAPSSG
jgi:hypothetical protein